MRNLLLAALVLAAGPAAGWAADKKWSVTGKMGFTLGGDVNVDPPDRDVDEDPGFLFGADLDAEVADQVSVGGRLKLGFPEVGDDGETHFSLGPSVKAHFKPDRKLRVSPGAALLFQNLSSVRGTGSSSGLGLDLFAEVGTPINDELDFVGELGFNAQPISMSDPDVTWGPLFYLMFGVRY